MNNIKTWFIWPFLPLTSTFLLRMFVTQHSFIPSVDILFYISLILLVLLFLPLLVQEGIFDATSSGFRRMRYQLASRSKKRILENDNFLNLKQVKEEYYTISTWSLPTLTLCVFYFILTILISIFL